jgi:hypothetical protein
VQLDESFRDDSGRARQRTIANFGRLEQISDNVESIIKGLLKATGDSVPENGLLSPPPQVSFDSARSLGDVWTLTSLWNELGFDSLRRVFRKSRHKIDIEALLRMMVFNRLCNPESNLGMLRWL